MKKSSYFSTVLDMHCENFLVKFCIDQKRHFRGLQSGSKSFGHPVIKKMIFTGFAIDLFRKVQYYATQEISFMTPGLVLPPWAMHRSKLRGG